MTYNYRKLLGRIKEFGFTQETLANKTQMSAWSLNQKLGSHSEFKQGEILRICQVLDIDNPAEFFFCLDA